MMKSTALFVDYLYVFHSNTVLFVSLPNATAMTPITIAIVKMPKIKLMGEPAATKYPTNNGPKIPPIRPAAAAIPAPVPLITVGYCSGV